MVIVNHFSIRLYREMVNSGFLSCALHCSLMLLEAELLDALSWCGYAVLSYSMSCVLLYDMLSYAVLYCVVTWRAVLCCIVRSYSIL